LSRAFSENNVLSPQSNSAFLSRSDEYLSLQAYISSLLPRIEGSLLSANACQLRYMQPFVDILEGKLKSPSIFIERLLFELEHSNQSHTGALLFPVFLGIPFIKKDICMNGLFSISQVISLLMSFNINQSCSESSNRMLEKRFISNTTPSFDDHVYTADSLLVEEAVLAFRTKALAMSYYYSPCVRNVEKGIVNPFHLHLYSGVRNYGF
jgi:hypothetical protein